MMVRAFPKGRDSEESFSINMNFVDFDFIDHFGIEMAAGRKFSDEYASDRKDAFIINEATVRKWGLSSPEEAVRKKLLTGFYGLEGTVIGVIKDHHISSFHHEIEPQVLLYNPQYFMTMAVKVKSDDSYQLWAHHQIHVPD